ncbi:predicted protein [Aspergillus nidulans FGSC A4]|nr:predicted protein [Aspergillus nidulans FGSC A4]|eukprot:XP_663360.1 predicted protein [Aspergillus nidulans FGSC A4]
MISVLLTAHTIALSYIVITSIQSPSDGGEYAISAQTDNAYVPAETSVAQQTAGRLSARRDLSDTAEDSIKTSPITAQNIVSEYRQEPNKLKTISQTLHMGKLIPLPCPAFQNIAGISDRHIKALISP